MRSLLRFLVPAVLGACLVLQLSWSAQAATGWGPVRSKGAGAVGSGTWSPTTRLLGLTLTDRTRGPKCAWAIVKAGGYTVPLHVCNGTRALRFQVTQTGPVEILICSGTRRAAAGETCRTKVLV